MRHTIVDPSGYMLSIRGGTYCVLVCSLARTLQQCALYLTPSECYFVSEVQCQLEHVMIWLQAYKLKNP